MAAMDQRADCNIDKEAWPRLNAKEYEEAFGRNYMSTLVILDESRLVMFGQRPGEVYDFGEEVREKARAMQKNKDGA